MNKSIKIIFTDGSSFECNFAEDIRSDTATVRFSDFSRRPGKYRSFPLVNIRQWIVE